MWTAAASGVLLAAWVSLVYHRHLHPHIVLHYGEHIRPKVKALVDKCVAIHDYAPTPFHLVDIGGFLATVVPFFFRVTRHFPL